MAFDPVREGQATEKNLNWGYWWVTHKTQVRTASTVALAVVAFGLFGFAAFGFADWFFGSGVRERAGIAEMARPAIDYQAIREANAPKQLGLDAASVLPSGDKKYDFLAGATNPNKRWVAEFEYRFTSDNAETQAKKGYLLPGESRFINALGVTAESRPGSPRLVIENLAWKRVDPHKTLPNYDAWSAARMHFIFSDVTFVPPDPSSPIATSRASFTVTNDSGFGYFNIGFSVALYSGSRVVGINEVVLSDLRAGERRPVEVSWFYELPGVTKVDVRPVINLLDDRVYIPPGS